MANKTTVTHPDGTVSTRTSAKAVYAYAVEEKIDRHQEAVRMRESADRYRDRNTDEDIAYADRLDASATAVTALPRYYYRVVRWSGTRELAEKGAHEYRFYDVRVVPVDERKD